MYGSTCCRNTNLNWKYVDLNNKIIKLNGKGSKDRIHTIPELLRNFLLPRKVEKGVFAQAQNYKIKYQEGFEIMQIKFHVSIIVIHNKEFIWFNHFFISQVSFYH